MPSTGRTAPQPPAPAPSERRGRPQQRQGGRFVRQGATGKRRRSSSEPGWCHRKAKPVARDHHRVTEMATWGDLPLADQESLRFEGEQELRRSAIVWHWRALGAPGPDHWDTQPGPSSMPGTAKLIQLLMGLPDKCRETIRIVPLRSTLHDTFYPLALEGKKCHEACGCMGGTPIPTVTLSPLIVSKRGG